MLYFLGKRGSAKRTELSKFVVWFRNTQSQPDAEEPATKITDATISRQLTAIQNLFGIRLSKSKNFGVSIVYWGFLSKEAFYKTMEERVDLEAYEKLAATE